MNDIIITSPTDKKGSGNGSVTVKPTSKNTELCSIKKNVIIKGNGVDPITIITEHKGIDSILEENGLTAGEIYAGAKWRMFSTVKDKYSVGIYERVSMGDIKTLGPHYYARTQNTNYGTEGSLPANTYAYAIINGNVPVIDEINAEEGISKYIYKYGDYVGSRKLYEPLDNTNVVWLAPNNLPEKNTQYQSLYFINTLSSVMNGGGVHPIATNGNLSLAEYLPFFGSKGIACTQDLIDANLTDDDVKYKASVYVVIGRTQGSYIPDTPVTSKEDTPMEIFDKKYIIKSTLIDVYKYHISVFVNGVNKNNDLTGYVTSIGPSGYLYAHNETTYTNLLKTRDGKLVCDDVYIMHSRRKNDIRRWHEMILNSNYTLDKVTVSAGAFFNKYNEVFKSRYNHPIEHLSDWTDGEMDYEPNGQNGERTQYDHYENEDLYQFDLSVMNGTSSTPDEQYVHFDIVSAKTLALIKQTGWNPENKSFAYPYVCPMPVVNVNIYIKSK